MSTLDTGLTLIRTPPPGGFSAANGWMGNAFQELDADRALCPPRLLIMIRAEWWCCNRSWRSCSWSGTGTRSRGTSRLRWCRISPPLIDVYKGYPQDKDRAPTEAHRPSSGWGWVVDFLPVGDMPPPGPKAVLSSLLDQTLSRQLGPANCKNRSGSITVGPLQTWWKSAFSSTMR